METIYSPQYSSNFTVRQGNDSRERVISVADPWQGADNINYNLIISEKGTDTPVSGNTQVLNKEAKRIVCMSSTHIAMLDALGATDRIVAVSGKEYISNPRLVASSNLIPDIGYEGNIDYETLVAVQPDLVLLFSINGSSSMEPKLREFGISYLYIGDYLEENPLGKAEWIVPLAEVIGEREKGIEIFNGIAERYQNLKESVIVQNQRHPKVMVNAPFMDSWFMPSSKSYVAQMINDAGGDYIYKKNTGNSSLPIDLEEALSLVAEADYWINIGAVRSRDELQNTFPKFMSADCVINGNIYNNNLRSTLGGGNDCYESGVVNPDLVLRDMIKIFHPSLISDDFTYYQKLE